MDEHDLEKGPHHHASNPSAVFVQQQEALAIATQYQGDNTNPHFHSELEIFQGLVGIKYLREGGEPLETAEDATGGINPFLAIFVPSKTNKARLRNRGVYKRAVAQDMKNRSMYAITHYIISGLYIIQVLVAATLTALSAYGGTSTIVLTVFGAINTVIAGLLAWLTGQGMPSRYRRARDQYREVIRHTEAMERRFAQINRVNWPEGQRPDPVHERDRIVKMFEEARKDQEANYPETTQTPASEQMEAKNDELRDELAKWRSKKKDQEQELIRLKEELQTAKAGVQAGLKSGKEAIEEVRF